MCPKVPEAGANIDRTRLLEEFFQLCQRMASLSLGARNAESDHGLALTDASNLEVAFKPCNGLGSTRKRELSVGFDRVG